MALSLSLMLAGRSGRLRSARRRPSSPARLSHYKLGAFAIAAGAMGGNRLGAALGVWVALAGMAAGAGLINSFLCTAARGVQAMAQRGLLPARCAASPPQKTRRRSARGSARSRPRRRCWW